MSSDPVDSINDLEATYYAQGYADGFAHGALHGLYEGRELGQEKCFEWWEELGYLEGQAEFFKRLAGRADEGVAKKVTARTLKSIDQLLDLIHSFPTVNPTPTTSATPSNPSTEPEPIAATTTDLPALITRIRAKYRLICSSLGVKPRLAVRSGVEGDVMADRSGEMETQGVDGVGIATEPNTGVVDSRLLQF